MIILAKVELTLLIIFIAYIHLVFRLTRVLWVALIDMFFLTALYEPSASQSCSLLYLSHSSTTT